MRYLLGMDDTDSRFGHCTTHLGYLITCELARMGCRIPSYPRLVRLNPNVPFKTRGNAAVCVEFEPTSESLRDRAFDTAEALLDEEADVGNGANPGLVMASKEEAAAPYFRELYLRALSGMVSYRGVIHELVRMGLRHTLLGNGMGAVGAAASLGFSCDSDDHTYELIAYRRPERCGTLRSVLRESVVEMEAETFPHTFNNYDHESGRVLLAPTGPDPVLAGVRGDSPGAVLEAFRRVRTGEVPLGHMVYATNQCTDAHLKPRLSVPLKAYSAGWLEGEVVSLDAREGGHLELALRVAGADLRCMVYEPSGDLKRTARLLRTGDSVRVSGGVRRATPRNSAALNVEKIEVLALHQAVKARPRCALCSSGMKSEGRGKGYQCRTCGHRTAALRVEHGPPSRIHPGTYLPSPRAQRHLTKQLIRYGRELAGHREIVEGWVAR
ncbi:MAG: DUF1743 domain-containing protein [Nitrososphaerota archaeon]|nr:DUF1743 domain-containing protein [Nitrososphaerota archaeon]MDG6966225.1 DUF1743 domain-containing protein [Nitrososphaerota archaeon]MDG6977660.1 DUF1743 domain-containing protein [Nitrososphaerota archaeon]MDG7020650.1 DUF1743 domain-containing protein [Nitrososphaerota archaeon]MDG7021985.1 DUF1743 domain-containing protein [Nitrososphaerota archaeon]